MRERVVRWLALALAALSLVIGAVALVATDWVLEWVPGDVVVALEALGRLALYLFLFLVLVQSYRIARHRFVSPVDEATLPPRERARAIPIPGDDLAYAVAAARDRSGSTFQAVRTRLEQVSRDVLEREQPADDATRRLADGSWTDDAVAASVLAETVDPPQPFGERVRRSLGLTWGLTTRDLRRTMRAIASVADVPIENDRPTPPRPRIERSADVHAEDGGSKSDDGDGSQSGDDQLQPGDVDGSQFEDGDESRVSEDETARSDDEEPQPDDEEPQPDERHGSHPDERHDSHPDDSAEGPTDERETTPTRRSTGHWNGITVVALLGLVLGVLYQQPAIVGAAAVGIGFAAYARLETDLEPELTVERVVSDSQPEPGEEVAVTLTVRNDGESRLVDLRLVDGVPPSVAVTDGSPRLGTSLAAGETAAIQYTITARRGTLAFEPVVVVSRSVSGGTELTERVSPQSTTTITCEPTLMPLSSTTDLPLWEGARRAGQLVTNDPGPGLEFHSVREYQPGDPVGRIDWHRYARTNDLSTVSFDDERAAVVVVAIDARSEAYYRPEPSTDGDDHAVDRSVTGAARAFESLLADAHSVGLASIGPDPLWLAPGTGDTHRERGRTLLATHDAIGPEPPASTGDDLGQIDRLPPDAQLLLFSPLCDEAILEVVRTIRSRGPAVTVVSPDPTTTAYPAGAIAHLERSLRIDTLRNAGVSVVDWAWNRPLEAALRGRR